jgi:hypothetical protein
MPPKSELLAKLDTILDITNHTHAAIKDLIARMNCIEDEIQTLKIRQARIEGAIVVLCVFTVAALVFAVASILLTLWR